VTLCMSVTLGNNLSGAGSPSQIKSAMPRRATLLPPTEIASSPFLRRVFRNDTEEIMEPVRKGRRESSLLALTERVWEGEEKRFLESPFFCYNWTLNNG